MATPSGILTSSPVTSALFIGGKERQTAEKMAIADPAKPGVVVGHAASATEQDVRDAIVAAKAAYPAWAALTPQQRAEKMMAALKGIDGANRDTDAAILSLCFANIPTVRDSRTQPFPAQTKRGRLASG